MVKHAGMWRTNGTINILEMRTIVLATLQLRCALYVDSGLCYRGT